MAIGRNWKEIWKAIWKPVWQPVASPPGPVTGKFGKAIAVPNTGTSTLNGLVITDHQDFDFGTGDFTIDLWAYRSANTYVGTLFYGTLGGGEFSVKVGTDGLIDLIYRSSGGSQSFTNVATWPVGQWVYFVAQRRGTNWETYLNGVLIHSAAITGGAGSTVNSGGDLYFGRTNVSSAQSWNGYLDDIRVTRGAARIAPEITLPAAQFPDAAPADPDFASVVLSLHCEGANGGTTFTDSSSLAKTPSSVISATTSSEQAKWGSTSGKFMTTNNEVRYASSSDFDLPGDFTIEAWVYRITVPTTLAQNIVCRRVYDTTGAGTWRMTDSGFQDLTSGTIRLGWTIPYSQWVHVAVSRRGNLIMGFVAGKLVSASVDTTNYTNTQALLIGRDNDLTGFGTPFGGHIDDLRITKGVARYTADFTPPALTFCESVASASAEIAGTLQGRVLKLTQGSLSVSNVSPNFSLQGGMRRWDDNSGNPRWIEFEFQPNGEIWAASSESPTPALRDPSFFSYPWNTPHYWGLPINPAAGASYRITFSRVVGTSNTEVSGLALNTAYLLDVPRRIRFTNVEGFAYINEQFFATVSPTGPGVSATVELWPGVIVIPSPDISPAVRYSSSFVDLVFGPGTGEESVRTLTLEPDGTVTTNAVYGADARPGGVVKWLASVPRPDDGKYYNVSVSLSSSAVVLSGELLPGQSKRLDSSKTLVLTRQAVAVNTEFWLNLTFKVNQYHRFWNRADYEGVFSIRILNKA